MLIKLLESIDPARKRYSWQYPNGMFIPVKYSHGSDAVKITGVIDDPIMAAWKRGFMRITHIGNVLYAHNELMLPNEKQKAALINLAIDTGDVEIVYDNGTNDSVLWSKNNSL